MKTEQQIIDELKSLQNIAEHMGCPVVINNEHMARIFKEALCLIGDQAMSIKGLENKIAQLREQIKRQEEEIEHVRANASPFAGAEARQSLR